jgi:hypothetical protein
MKTCPRCGAENRQTAAECRLCATPLENPEDLLIVRAEGPFPEQIPPGDDISGPSPVPGRTPVPAAVADKICPDCQAANDPDWLYCQQCGRSLPAEVPAPEVPGRAEVPAAPVGDAMPESAAVDQASGAPPAPAAAGPSRNSPQPASAAPSAPSRPPSPPVASGPVGPRRAEPEASGKGQSAGEKYTANGPGQNASGQQPGVPVRHSIACASCGHPAQPNALYCSNCGKPVQPAQQGRSEGLRSKSASPKPDTPKAAIQMITEGGQGGESYPIDAGEVLIGRLEGDVTFPHDGYMSVRHARVIEHHGRYYLADLGSRNGTFVRIKAEIELQPGDTFLVGKQVFKFDKK